MLKKPIYNEVMKILIRYHRVKRLRMKHLTYLFCKEKKSENKKIEMEIFFEVDFSDTYKEVKKIYGKNTLAPEYISVLMKIHRTEMIDTLNSDHGLWKVLDTLYKRDLIDKKRDASKDYYFVPTEKGTFLFTKINTYRTLDTVLMNIDKSFNHEMTWEHCKSLNRLRDNIISTL